MLTQNSRKILHPPGSDRLAEELDDFLDSMPGVYRREHDTDEIRTHWELVARRAASLAHVEGMRYRVRPGRWICVVTDDRPGLLSLLSAAIAANGLDIQSARAYCRSRAQLPDEAVDFFCVRQQNHALDHELKPGQLDSIRSSIESLLLGELDVASLARRGAARSQLLSEHANAAYFQDAPDSDLLIVRSADHPGLLLKITLTLFREGLTIRRSNVATFHDMASDEFELSELDGSPLTEARKASVVRSVLAVLAQRIGS